MTDLFGGVIGKGGFLFIVISFTNLTTTRCVLFFSSKYHFPRHGNLYKNVALNKHVYLALKRAVVTWRSLRLHAGVSLLQPTQFCFQSGTVLHHIKPCAVLLEGDILAASYEGSSVPYMTGCYFREEGMLGEIDELWQQHSINKLLVEGDGLNAC